MGRSEGSLQLGDVFWVFAALGGELLSEAWLSLTEGIVLLQVSHTLLVHPQLKVSAWASQNDGVRLRERRGARP